NTDHWDDWHTLKGSIKEDAPKAPWYERLQQGTGTPDDSGRYYRNLDKPQSKADSDAPSAAIFVAAHALTDPKVKEAIKLTEEGKHPDYIWRKTERAPVPTRAEHIPDVPPAERPWMREINDQNATIKQGPHRTPDGRLRTGQFRLTTMLDHPELFSAEPHFKMTKVQIGPDVLEE